MGTDWDYIDRMREALPKDLFDARGPAMHHREFAAKFKAKETYLGTDALAVKLNEEFNALSAEEKRALETNPGKYGVYSLSDTREVNLALTVVAKEHFAEYRFNEFEIRDLSDPEQVEKISKRFPEMTSERIALVLA